MSSHLKSCMARARRYEVGKHLARLRFVQTIRHKWGARRREAESLEYTRIGETSRASTTRCTWRDAFNDQSSAECQFYPFWERSIYTHYLPYHKQYIGCIGITLHLLPHLTRQFIRGNKTNSVSYNNIVIKLQVICNVKRSSLQSIRNTIIVYQTISACFKIFTMRI